MNLAALSNAFDKSTGAASPAQRAALDALLAAGFPTRRDELWKYTRSDALADFALRALAAEHAAPANTDALRASVSALLADYGDAGVLAFVDGKLDHALTVLPAGVTLREADAEKDTADGTAANALRLLNTALPTARLTLDVADGVSATEAVHIVHRVGSADVLSQVRLNINVGREARLTVVEHFDDPGALAQMHNTLVRAHVADGGELRMRRIQSLDDAALQVTRIEADVETAATLDTLTLDTGAKLVRNDLNVRLLGEGAHVTMRAVYLGSGSQHIDNHTRVDHVAKNTTSVEDYRGILLDRCRCVFNGKVMVHEGADGTDAAQSNPNLLLSDDAEIDTKPELEIYADDVKCSHGATVGQTDEKSLFYLRSRGIDRDTAMQLLTYAFCREALLGIDSDALRIQMETLVADQIPNFSALELIA